MDRHIIKKSFLAPTSIAACLAALALAALFPRLVSTPLGMLGLRLDPEGLGGVALVLFVLSCLSTGIGVVLLRVKAKPLIAIGVALACLASGVVFWPKSIYVSKEPDGENGYVDSGFLVYRPIWRGPYEHTGPDGGGVGNVESVEKSGSAWFGETTIYTRADASDRGGYGLEDVPTLPRVGWTEDDVREIRRRADAYRCLHRHERTIGPLVIPPLLADTKSGAMRHEPVSALA